jgi:hypothetical protein
MPSAQGHARKSLKTPVCLIRFLQIRFPPGRLEWRAWFEDDAASVAVAAGDGILKAPFAAHVPNLEMASPRAKES